MFCTECGKQFEVASSIYDGQSQLGIYPKTDTYYVSLQCACPQPKLGVLKIPLN